MSRVVRQMYFTLDYISHGKVRAQVRPPKLCRYDTVASYVRKRIAITIIYSLYNNWLHVYIATLRCSYHIAISYNVVFMYSQLYSFICMLKQYSQQLYQIAAICWLQLDALYYFVCIHIYYNLYGLAALFITHKHEPLFYCMWLILLELVL